MNNEFNNNYNNYNNQPTGGYPPVQDPNMMNNNFQQQGMNYNQGMYNQPYMMNGYNTQPQNNYNNQYDSLYTTGTTSSNSTKNLIVIVAIVLALIVGYVFYTQSKGKNNSLIGTWNCTGTSSLKFDFNKNKTFLIHNKGINDNYIKGTYTVKSSSGTNSEYKYYQYHLVATELYSYGKKNTNPGIGQTYEIGVSKDGKNATIVSTDNKENYVCTK